MKKSESFVPSGANLKRNCEADLIGWLKTANFEKLWVGRG